MFFHPDLKTQLYWNRVFSQYPHLPTWEEAMTYALAFTRKQALAIKRAKAYREHRGDPVAEITAVLNEIGHDPSQDDDWRYR